ncbi:MAG: hypothetical protein COV70_00295 [Parcubacteria group bacterium CG11_big_fil_rev_8_21_14_0_20_39_22]|nr:MAG: hypothetical protein COV70_00295 [Parcubacteria group bacterium CG11_big_fil_rev_8_21_14_0_20_39_22]
MNLIDWLVTAIVAGFLAWWVISWFKKFLPKKIQAHRDQGQPGKTQIFFQNHWKRIVYPVLGAICAIALWHFGIVPVLGKFFPQVSGLLNTTGALLTVAIFGVLLVISRAIRALSPILVIVGLISWFVYYCATNQEIDGPTKVYVRIPKWEYVQYKPADSVQNSKGKGISYRVRAEVSYESKAVPPTFTFKIHTRPRNSVFAYAIGEEDGKWDQEKKSGSWNFVADEIPAPDKLLQAPVIAGAAWDSDTVGYFELRQID